MTERSPTTANFPFLLQTAFPEIKSNVEEVLGENGLDPGMELITAFTLGSTVLFASLLEPAVAENDVIKIGQIYQFVEHMVGSGDRWLVEALTKRFVWNLADSEWDEVNSRFAGPRVAAILADYSSAQ